MIGPIFVTCNELSTYVQRSERAARVTTARVHQVAAQQTHKESDEGEPHVRGVTRRLAILGALEDLGVETPHQQNSESGDHDR